VEDITLILLAAGSSSRFGSSTKKQWLYQAEKPLWLSVADSFTKSFSFAKIIIVATSNEVAHMKQFANYNYVTGGNTRQASLKNALEKVETPFVLVNDIARCCIDIDMIKRVISHKDKAYCIVPALKATDTMYLNDKPIDRDSVRIIQTPQLSHSDTLREALALSVEFTDESSAIHNINKEVIFVEGSTKAHKLTSVDDLKKLPCLKSPSNDTRVGFGIDTHPFEAGKIMKLCGVSIDSTDFGFKAHSDGDVAIHALIDALLGAAGMGDIGELFPDTDSLYTNADSSLLLAEVVEQICSFGFAIGNIDMTIVAQTPKLMNYKNEMRKTIAGLTELPLNRINIKATTAEKLGFIGREEGVTVHAVATLKYFDWKGLL
jgi:2-C-methyl-D-erythritol 4-phosphate cytidylyltransferase/2-C-methyl-D-erythritol 2,4-cyclodiphosphate synthase